MAKIIFEKGVQFRFENGYGTVIDDNGKSAIITGKGGRTGYQTEMVESVPAGAETLHNAQNFEVQFALQYGALIVNNR